MISIKVNEKIQTVSKNILKISEYLNHLYDLREYEEEPLPIMNYNESNFEIFMKWFNVLNKTLDYDVDEEDNEIFYTEYFDNFDIKQKIELFNFAMGNQFKILCDTIAYSMKDNNIYKKNNRFFICTGFNEETEQFETVELNCVLAKMINLWKTKEYKPGNNFRELCFHYIARKCSFASFYKLYKVWKTTGFNIIRTKTFGERLVENEEFDIYDLEEMDNSKFDFGEFSDDCIVFDNHKELLLFDVDEQHYQLWLISRKPRIKITLKINKSFRNFMAFVNGYLYLKCDFENGVLPLDVADHEVKDEFEKQTIIIAFDEDEHKLIVGSTYNSVYLFKTRNCQNKRYMVITPNFNMSFECLQYYVKHVKGFGITDKSYETFTIYYEHLPSEDYVKRFFSDFNEQVVVRYKQYRKHQIEDRLEQIINKQQNDVNNLKKNPEAEYAFEFDGYEGVETMETYDWENTYMNPDIDLTNTSERIIRCSISGNDIFYSVKPKYLWLHSNNPYNKLIIDTRKENITSRQITEYLQNVKHLNVVAGCKIVLDKMISVSEIKQLFLDAIESL